MDENKVYAVSIKCMTYNQSSYITDAMNGFVMQHTNFPFVAVIVDDASTDGEQRVIRKYVDEHFDHSVDSGYKEWETEDAFWTYAQHKENKNCHFVMVYLKKNLYKQQEKKQMVIKDWVNSKYIALCEGDDYWTDPMKLQKQVVFLEENECYSMCCSAFSQTFNGNEKDKQVVILDLDEVSIDDLLKETWIGTLTTVFRGELLADYRPPFPNLPFGDLPLWFHFATKGKIKYLKETTANYRSLSDSACHFPDRKAQYKFSLEAMRVREYYAKRAGRIEIACPFFSKNAHFILDQSYKNKWFDFPMDSVWHFINEYGNPSGYDKLKYWGMKSRCKYRLSEVVMSMMGKSFGKC